MSGIREIEQDGRAENMVTARPIQVRLRRRVVQQQKEEIFGDVPHDV